MSSRPHSNASDRQAYFNDLHSYWTNLSSMPPTPSITSSEQPRVPSRKGRRSPKSSPKRRPLHERSSSHANERVTPTIRIVDEPDTDIYSKTPFPNRPSQVLSPQKVHTGYAFERQGSTVSDRQPAAPARPDPETSTPAEDLVPKPLERRKTDRASTATATTATTATETDKESTLFSLRSSQVSRFTTPPSSPSSYRDGGEDALQTPRDETSPGKRASIRAVAPSTSTASESLTVVPSLVSHPSSASTETIRVVSPDDDKDSPADQRDTPPPPKSPTRPLQTPTSEKEPQFSDSPNVKPASKASSESLAPSESSIGPSRSPSASPATTHAIVRTTSQNSLRVRYPIVRAPSAGGLRAESRVLPKNPSRMSQRPQQQQWGSQLSPASEATYGSLGGMSRSIAEASEPGPNLQRGYTVRSDASSSIGFGPSGFSDTSSSQSPPAVSPAVYAQRRDSDEHHDTVSELQSPPPLRQQRSGYLSRFSATTESGQISRPSSAQSDTSSILSSSIPAWARYYYRRGSRTSINDVNASAEDLEYRAATAHSGRSGSPTDFAFPQQIYVPRNRPFQGGTITPPQFHHPGPHPGPYHYRDPRDSMAITPNPLQPGVYSPVAQDVYVSSWQHPHVVKPFSPHLARDRRSQAFVNAWRVPSLDESFENHVFSRCNRQIFLFCLGFVLPVAWVVASFLPLPRLPVLSKEISQRQMDVEAALARDIGFLDDYRYAKARWWRRLNRVMSVVGILLIATIVVLAVFTARMAQMQQQRNR